MLVTAIGELLIDFTQSGETADGYPVLTANPGGAPANFLAAVKACGHDAALLGKVGDDAFGRRLIGTLRQKGVITDGIVTAPDVFTTLAFVTLDGTGERSFSFARKPGADTCLRPEELDLSLLDAADVLHFGTLSMTDEPAKARPCSRSNGQRRRKRPSALTRITARRSGRMKKQPGTRCAWGCKMRIS